MIIYTKTVDDSSISSSFLESWIGSVTSCARYENPTDQKFLLPKFVGFFVCRRFNWSQA